MGRQAGSDDPTARPLFLNVNDDLGFAQFLREALVLEAQLLVFLGHRITLGLGAAFAGGQSLQRSGLSLATPGCQQRGIQSFTAQQRSDTAGALGLVGLGQNTLLVFGAEAAARGLRHDLGIGVGPLRDEGGFAVRGTALALATLGFPPSHGRQNRLGRSEKLIVVHVENPSRPAQ